MRHTHFSIAVLLGLLALLPAEELLAQGRWIKIKSMPTARWQASAGLIRGRIYVAGGYNRAKGGVITPVEAYVISTGLRTSAEVSKYP